MLSQSIARPSAPLAYLCQHLSIQQLLISASQQTTVSGARSLYLSPRLFTRLRISGCSSALDSTATLAKVNSCGPEIVHSKSMNLSVSSASKVFLQNPVERESLMRYSLEETLVQIVDSTPDLLREGVLE